MPGDTHGIKFVDDKTKRPNIRWNGEKTTCFWKEKQHATFVFL